MYEPVTRQCLFRYLDVVSIDQPRIRVMGFLPKDIFLAILLGVVVHD